MLDFRGSRLGAWAWIGLWVAFGTVVLADANRFLPPTGERYVDRLGSGGGDLIPSYNAAYALLKGENPYHFSDVPELPIALSYEGFKYQYPPTHFFVYVPLVWFAGTDFNVAARAQFFLTLLVAAALAWAVVDLTRASVPMQRDLRYAIWPVLTLILILNPGSQLGLERGQSDLFTATLCWWAAACFQRRQHTRAAFFAVASGLLKGYGVPFGAGLLLLGLRRGSMRGTLAGAALAATLFLAPVAHYLPEALHAFPTRAKMFWSTWNNQSFYNLFYVLDPSIADSGRDLAIAFAGAVSTLSWWRLQKVLNSEVAAERASALTLYACSTLIFILSFSRNSLAYDAVLILPGALSMVMTQARFTHSSFTATIVGVWLSAIVFGLCGMSWTRLCGVKIVVAEVPLNAWGQLGLLVLIAALSLRSSRGAPLTSLPALVRPVQS